MENPKISVVMTTYNGEKYLSEQINSILVQSKKPDELLILDDCSTDNSKELVEQLTESCRDINIKIIKNSSNQGWKANFIKGFHMASGDIIFCADQDDIWNMKKIERMSDVMRKNSHINALCCNLNPLYHDGAERLANFAVNNYGNKHLEKVSFKDSGFRVIRPGCTMCFRKSMLKAIDAVWTPQLAHDEVIWAIALATDSLYILNEPLIQFRRHANNNSPSNDKVLAARLDRAICNKIKMENLLFIADELGVSQDIQDFCKRTYRYSIKRIKAFEKRSLIQAISILPSIRNKYTLRSWAADIYTIIRSK